MMRWIQRGPGWSVRVTRHTSIPIANRNTSVIALERLPKTRETKKVFLSRHSFHCTPCLWLKTSSSRGTGNVDLDYYRQQVKKSNRANDDDDRSNTRNRERTTSRYKGAPTSTTSRQRPIRKRRDTFPQRFDSRDNSRRNSQWDDTDTETSKGRFARRQKGPDRRGRGGHRRAEEPRKKFITDPRGAPEEKQRRVRIDKNKEMAAVEEEKEAKAKKSKDRWAETARRRNRAFPPNKLDVFVSCHPGLESILSEELNSLGINNTIESNGARLESPTLDDIFNCYLHLGTASQVLLRCGESFPARAFGELRRKVEKLRWKELLNKDVQLKVKVTSSKSRLLHTTAIRDRIIEAINESLGRDAEENDKDKEADLQLVVRVFRDRVQMSITSATPLHQRGYRFETAKAPLREDLAFALLYTAGWKPRGKSKGKAGGSFPYKAILDPFCGSGTIPIEAAAIASGLPPGRKRQPPLQGTVLYDPKKWESLVAKALRKTSRVDSSEIQIACSDRNKRASQIAKSNAKRAGVQLDIQHCAFSSHPWLDQPSTAPENFLIAANLPFGRRISPKVSKTQLLPIYQTLANCFTKLSNAGNSYTSILLTDDPNLVRRSGFKRDFDVKLNTSHGGIPVFGMLSSETKHDDDTKEE